MVVKSADNKKMIREGYIVGNQRRIKDSASIYDSSLWPKPEIPVARGSKHLKFFISHNTLGSSFTSFIKCF
ncbi:hypothetical protein B9G39_12050 [Zooshikella ganghwensis]|uniref:Uncharacterized protein n=1 Tax=Zooshikella ganghwensis TaxID=202772 RepID=A0A4V1INL2_9GAMM|nr:hypothetical protein B9G39_12050 [Zooshikella ganghwensis]